MEDDSVHGVGEGFLALPEAERHSGRWAAVCLTDADGVPLPIRGVPVGAAGALTAALLPDTDGITLPLKRELLGVGAVFAEAASIKDCNADGVGVRPANGRLSDWLFVPAVGRLLGRRVLLEVHVAWPACTCGLLTVPGAPGKVGIA
jgi:hypothetical protein